MRSGSLERYAREGRESGTRAAFKAEYYGEDESEAARAARHARPRYKTRSPSAQRPPLAPSRPSQRTQRSLSHMMKQARRSLSASPVTAPRSYIPAKDVHVKALAEERQAHRSMTPDDPVIAARIAAEDRARMEKYRSGSIQMSERERQRRMPRSSVPPATDVPVHTPKIIQRTEPRDLRAMRS